VKRAARSFLGREEGDASVGNNRCAYFWNKFFIISVQHTTNSSACNLTLTFFLRWDVHFGVNKSHVSLIRTKQVTHNTGATCTLITILRRSSPLNSVCNVSCINVYKRPDNGS
jgi:hypothetical protein